MCAQPNSPNVTKQVSIAPTSTSQASKNQSMNRNQKRNKHSRGEKRNSTPQQSGSAQKPNNESRNAKRARWAKKMRPQQKPVVHKSPEHEYISACCLVPARKPRAGAKEAAKDPESGRIKDKVKGLGHWRCGQCGKVCKVTPRKPEPKVTALYVGNMANNTVPCVVLPATLHTPTIFVPPALETLVVAASFPVAPPGVIARIVTFDGPDMGRGTEVIVEKPKAEVV